jgi:hypothetical protein
MNATASGGPGAYGLGLCFQPRPTSLAAAGEKICISRRNPLAQRGPSAPAQTRKFRDI